MDELKILRDLAPAAHAGDEADVRRHARADLDAAIAVGHTHHPGPRAWLPRVAISGAVVVALGLLGASFLRTNKAQPVSQLPTGEVEAIGMVVQRPDWPHARLCVSAMTPEDCKGIELVGWRWSELRPADVESLRGEDEATHQPFRLKFASDYVIVGHFDDDRLVVTQRPKRIDPRDNPQIAIESRRTTACDPRPRVRRDFSDQETLNLTSDLFAIPQDSIVTWTSGQGDSMNVLNVRIARDARRYLPAIRLVYGGPLCLIEGDVSNILKPINDESFPQDPLREFMYPGSVFPSVTLNEFPAAQLVPRVYDDGTFQAQMDRKYGKGRIRVQSFFRPALVDAARVDRFWNAFHYGTAQIDWVTSYHSLAELRAGSKLIVRGRIESVALSPASSPGLFYADLRVRVSATVAGAAPANGVITVRVMLLGATTAAQAKATITQLNRDLPAQDIVAFLASDGGVFRPLNDVGIWTHTGRARVDAPFAATPYGPTETPIADMPGVETLDQLVDAINYMGKFRTIPLP